MQLTEPQAGSDVGALRTKAERAGDGSYRITGSKIFITYGEHDLTDNIIHFVLARLPDAPPGTKGISLFLVPKFLVNDDGTLGARNDARAHSLEHKMGIHASPTATMVYGDQGGAVGYLIGKENAGMNCMFTMMNEARLSVGLQGVGIAEARAAAGAGLCARAQAGARAGHEGERVRADHRACRRAAHAADHARADRARRARFVMPPAWRSIAAIAARTTRRKRRGDERAALLTPVAKAFSTDIGIEVASLGVQVHGGMGFIEETGAAQHYRDARIAAIYEGTNGIQAIDLVGAQDCRWTSGAVVEGLYRRVARDRGAGEGGERSGFRRDRRRSCRDAVDALERATAWLLARVVERAGRGAWPAPRPICACSAMPPAAACWRTRRWRRCACAAMARANAADRVAARALLRREYRGHLRRAGGGR